MAYALAAEMYPTDANQGCKVLYLPKIRKIRVDLHVALLARYLYAPESLKLARRVSPSLVREAIQHLTQSLGRGC